MPLSVDLPHITATDGCPKHMVHGPCGGVGFDGACELGDRRCSFVDQPTVAYREGPDAARTTQAEPTPPLGNDLRALLRTGRVVVTDFPATALSATSISRTAEILAGRTHAVLAGDSPRHRTQFPPSYRATLIQATGLRAWAGVNCRDRNRVALEGELAALAHLGVAGVHCVTGDHTALGSRADARPVFDLDSTDLTARAAAAGLLTSVAESPASPPTTHRPGRLVEKVRAGAEVCFVNHCGGARPVRDFVTAVRSVGADPWFVACVPVVIDRGSAELLASFTSLVLPGGFLDRILSADDPRSAGVDAAVELAEVLLDVDGVAGVNLSGGSAAGRDEDFATALAEIGNRLGVRPDQPAS